MRGLALLLIAGVATAAEPEPLEDPRLPWRMGSLACLGGGVVALVLGGITFSQGLDDEDLIASAARDPTGVVTGVTQREALRLEDSAERAKTLGAVGLGLGGVLLAAGVGLYLLEPPPALVKPAEPEPEVRPFSLLPLLAPDGVGLAALATF